MTNNMANNDVIVRDINDIMNSDKAVNMAKIFREFYHPDTHFDIKHTMNEQTMSNAVNHKSDSIKYRYLGKTEVSEKDIEDMRSECSDILEKFEEKYKNYDEYHEYKKSLQEMFESYYTMMRDRHKENVKLIYQKCMEQFKNDINSVSFNNAIMELIDRDQREQIGDKIESSKRNIMEQIMNVARKHNLDEDEYMYVIHDVLSIINDTYERYNNYIRNNDEHFKKYGKIVEQYCEEIVKYFECLNVSKVGRIEMVSKKKIIENYMNELIESYKKKNVDYEHTYVEPTYFREKYENMINEIYENEYKMNINNIIQRKFRELIERKKGHNSIFVRCDIAESSLPSLNIEDGNVFEQLPDRHTYISHKIVDKLIEISELCGTNIFYFGKTYGYTVSNRMSKKIYSIELIKNLKGIKYEDEIPKKYVLNDKVRIEMFSTIQKDNMKNAVFIFSPKDLDMYNKFMMYMEANNVKDEIDGYFSL